MPIHLLAIRKFEEPRTWSIGMCSIAVVMLLMTCSQSGSFATSVSQITKSPQAAAALDGVGPEKVYQVVQSTFAEQPGVIEIDGAPLHGRTEPYVESAEVEEKEGDKQEFIELVRQARLAKLIDNNALSAVLMMQAQTLLFGTGEPSHTND